MRTLVSNVELSTAFKKLRLLIGPRVLVIPWLITIQFIK
jgi:hypothetical protein